MVRPYNDDDGRSLHVLRSTRKLPSGVLQAVGDERELRLPADVVFGLPPSTPPTSPSSAAWGIRERLEQAHDVVRERLVTVHRHQKALFDRSAVPISFAAGDHVWLLVPHMAPGQSSKFFSPWQGPFVVDTQLSDVLYRVTGLQHPFRTLVTHVNRLKPCHRRPADLSTVPEVPHAPPTAPPTLSQPSTYVPDATDALYDADVADAGERWDVPDDPQFGRPQRHRRLPAHLADFVVEVQ